MTGDDQPIVNAELAFHLCVLDEFRVINWGNGYRAVLD